MGTAEKRKQAADKMDKMGIFDFTLYDHSWLIGPNTCLHCKNREQAETLKLLLERGAVKNENVRLNSSGIVEGWY
jgi:hypothetical protein